MNTNAKAYRIFAVLSASILAAGGIIFSITYSTASPRQMIDNSTNVSPPDAPTVVVRGGSIFSANTCNTDAGSAAVVFSTKAISDQWILPDSAVQEIPFAGCNIEVLLPKGEIESASFVIHAEKDLKNIKIVDVDFSGTPEASNKITIDLKLVKAWYQAGGAGHDIGRSLISMAANVKILTPELLVNDLDLMKVDTKTKNNYLRTNDNGPDEYIDINSSKPISFSVDHFYPEYQVRDAGTMQPFSLESGKNQQVWLTVNTSKNTPPGKYVGSIKVQSDNGLSASIAINVTVPNFDLPASKLEYGIYYHGRLDATRVPTVSSEFKTPEQLKLELRDIAFHGIKIPVIYQDHNQIDLFLKYLQIMSDASFSTKDLYLVYLNTSGVETSAQLSNLKTQILRVKSSSIPFGVENIYVYGEDEAKGSKLIAQKPAWEMIHKMGQKTYVAGYAGTFEATGDLLDILVFAESPMKAEAAKYHSKGRKIFSYANPQSGVENPYLYRKNYGLLLWAAEFDGAMLYAYQHFMGEGWDDFDHAAYRDHNFTYPTSNGFVGTTEWEGVREAINDVRFVNLLESRIKNTISNNLTAKTVTANQAEAYLNNIKDTLNRTNHYGEYSQYINIDLDEVRRNITRYIELLE